ncbi:MAG: nitroreductase family protein [Tannerella sp.]|jgi:predicted oxidoreductase (fatty acid repression mutant protein)|nr:nitroreductase family protein [Tannerella sp.]
MEKTFREAIKHRRSYYAIAQDSPVSDATIEEFVRWVVTYAPSAFNSQSGRIVLLLGEHHAKLWNIVADVLRKIVSPNAFAVTEKKINGFAAGHGTALFFEDESVVKGLQEQLPTYAENFPVWSTQSSAMHQFALWTLLDDAGLGVSLQHYNPLIDEDVRRTWNLPANWKLIAQMPFGAPTKEPAPKTFQPLDERIKVFK